MLDYCDRQIWELMCETGARISDILALTRHAVRQQPLTLYEQKTRKKRSVRLSDELHTNLAWWYAPIPGISNDNGLAFYSPRSMDKPLNRSTYYRRLQKACKTAQTRASAHSARKLYARRVYEATGDIRAVQDALQHRYLTTTATYLDIDIDKLILDTTLQT